MEKIKNFVDKTEKGSTACLLHLFVVTKVRKY